MLYLGFPVLSLVYVLVLLIIHFSKKRVDSFESTLVVRMMFLNILGLLLELGCYAIFLYFKNPDSFISMLILKGYIAYISVFNHFITGYIFVLTCKNISKYDIKSYYKKIMLLFLPLTLIMIFISFVSPLKYYAVYPKYFTYGFATEALAISFMILFPIWTYKCVKVLISNSSEELKRKIALFFFGILISGAVGAVTQFLDHSFLIITSVHTLVIMLIYLTIENPDLKTIAKLELAVNTAEKANKAKSDFLSSMSHEIRTPLNAIVSLSHFNMEYKDLPDEIRENTKIILNSSDTLLEIVGNILDMNKIDSNSLSLVENEYNFKEEIKKLVSKTTTRIGDKKIKVKLSLDKNIPKTLIGDKDRVLQIINNLLTNAIKYTEKGSISLDITFTIKNNKCNLIINVTDTGAGIKKENMEKLFTKFERLDAPVNSVIEGTGLGLAITKNLVDMMNGNIKVRSKYGKGSTFIVTIPQKMVSKKKGKL